MAIYYWINQGRLGNLVFQYVALTHFAGVKDNIVCFENPLFDLALPVAGTLKIPIIPFIGPYIHKYANRVIDYLSEKSLFSRLTPENEASCNGELIESGQIVRSKGLLSDVVVLKGFFQHDQWLHDCLKLRMDMLERSQARLDTISKSRCRVAVHVRLGDYQNWAVFGKKGAIVPPDWYRNAIDYVREHLDAPEFIFFTDDDQMLAAYMTDVECKYYRGLDPVDDYIAISLCEHAIISPSTFAFGSVMLSHYEGKLIVAPKYWAGFKSSAWFPGTIRTDKIHYLEVDVHE